MTTYEEIGAGGGDGDKGVGDKGVEDVDGAVVVVVVVVVVDVELIGNGTSSEGEGEDNECKVADDNGTAMVGVNSVEVAVQVAATGATMGASGAIGLFLEFKTVSVLLIEESIVCVMDGVAVSVIDSCALDIFAAALICFLNRDIVCVAFPKPPSR